MTTLFKAHGLGNDYLVWEGDHALSAGRVRALCHRHTGVGGDGILEPVDTTRADLGVRIWNPDGSVAEKSGNGLRIFAWWWVYQRGGPSEFSVDTGHDVVTCSVGAEQIAVEMGQATVSKQQETVRVAGEAFSGWVVDVGNPHFVLFRDEPFESMPWRRWGEALEVAPRFPQRTNVQFAQVTDEGLQIRIWERGAGETSASGSSSCAVAAAAVATGRCEAGTLPVHMPGGTLTVHVRSDLALRLEGPVAPVGRFSVGDAWWSAHPG